MKSFSGSDVMDDSLRQAGNDAIAMVARGFEPVRIERQLLARAFDLVCKAEMRASGLIAPPMPERSTAGNVERMRAA